jgi:hypothetical protein
MWARMDKHRTRVHIDRRRRNPHNRRRRMVNVMRVYEHGPGRMNSASRQTHQGSKEKYVSQLAHVTPLKRE